MPRISIHLDEKTAAMLEKAVSISATSVSQWVGELVQRSLREDWPEGYWKLFGSVDDASFFEPEEPHQISGAQQAGFATDPPRE